ncbi:hypothetical protein GCM10010510_28370 [Streptomyces anandii JCM 4720]|nr:hypothetical protein GCM10010510_28370 [Streptomyces anandii JCM 4720]
MNAGASAAQHSARRTSRGPVVAGAVTFTLGTGAVATLAAALASLAVEGALAKRIVWVVVAVAVAVAAGVWRAGRTATPSPPDPVPLPHGSRTGSPQ